MGMRKASVASRSALKRISAGGVVLALTGLGLFALPNAAYAAGPTTVTVTGGVTLGAAASVGEKNSITVGNAGPSGAGISIKDTGPAGNGTTLGAGAAAAGCVQATADEVRCPLGTLTAATVNADDLNDVIFVLNDDVVVTVNGGAGDDDLRGGPGSDLLNGDADDDTIRGGAGADSINGGANNTPGGDTADYGSSALGVNVSLDGVANDGPAGELDNVTNVEIVEGSSHNDTLTGGGGDETLRGNNGVDMIKGGTGNDTLEGGNGADDLDGEGGTDTVTYNPASADLTITLDNAANDGANLGAEGDNVHSTNEVIIGGVGDDNITGSANPETLNGGGGNDTLHGLGGADNLNGGSGTDTASYAGVAGGTITLDGVANDAGQGDNVNTENVIGGTGADNITGSAGVNRLDGGPGGDIVNGGAGADTLVGGVGDGADTYNGGADVDTLTFAGLAGPVNIALDGSAGTDGDVANGVENATGSSGGDTITGNASRNTLTGGAGNDTLNGGDGNDNLNGNGDDDTLNGQDGADQLNGGPGVGGTVLSDADTYNGGLGVDSVTYAGRTANVTVTIGVGANDGEALEGDNVSSGVEKVTTGSGNDDITGDVSPETLTGGAGDDTIRGGGGNDVISGQGGDDTIFGGAGKDTVSGGPGNDIFHTADGIKDSINCGDGNDNTADTDAIDTKTSNCTP
jgi:Ca2+-binding RTX toxin-like protein